MIKPILSGLLTILIFVTVSHSQQKSDYTARIEYGNCEPGIATGLTARCGFLVVPENRKKPAGRFIKIPFLFVTKNETDPTKNVLLYTTGGPGYSTLANYDSITTRLGFLEFGGFIAFDQRGTKKSQPCLDCPEVNDAKKHAYKYSLSKDSAELAAVKKCREKFIRQGIDLSSYNTIESAADINDLRKLLKIDSLTLFGISYSGGLMLTVARNHPEGVKALILNSPLPGYVNYEEHALFNHEEALDRIFSNCLADSTHDPRYADLQQRFRKYFVSITGKSFYQPYVEKNSRDTTQIKYTKQELLDVIIDQIYTNNLNRVPFTIHDIISGNHAPYIKAELDGIFEGNRYLSHGMRYSVYCTEQIAYADKKIIKQQQSVLPWYAGYQFNNVTHPICDIWETKPVSAVAKTAVYSNIPALVLAGDTDPWCSVFYNRLIARTMPNSQLMIVRNNGHGARLWVDGVDYLKKFMENPNKKLISESKNVIIE